LEEFQISASLIAKLRALGDFHDELLNRKVTASDSDLIQINLGLDEVSIEMNQISEALSVINANGRFVYPGGASIEKLSRLIQVLETDISDTVGINDLLSAGHAVLAAIPAGGIARHQAGR
jgi:hypothetical protein